ncbi:MAG: response regulator [Burkholderiales bacterium]|nr:response regulator [Burkholderiales bacterium]
MRAAWWTEHARLGPAGGSGIGLPKHLILTQYLPLGLNLGSMAFAAFVILLWCYRRQEIATGLFGVLYLLVSIRNCSYFFTGDLGLPATLSSWLYLCAHVGSAALLGWFALAILTLGLFSVLVSGVHDFVWIRLLGRVDHSYWMPWTVPLTLPGFSMMLMTRVVRAFDEYEQINLTLEQKVQERTRELAAANAAKSHFLAAASHDLRQPVSAIGLITDLLHERLSDPSLRGLTDRLTRAVVSMESLLKGLLDLSRLDAGAVEVHPQHVPLQPLLDSIAAHETESARHKGLALRVRPTPATAWTDPILLEQILRNLVGNAVRHTERGGILVGIRPRGRHVLIQVWDTGAGISAADQARIFEEFVQLNNPGRERRRGLGLGLAIVKRAAQLMGSPLMVRSQVGRGSCFGVLVPTSTLPPETAEPPSDALHSPAGLHAPWIDRKVLLIEDDQAMRDALSHLLRGWGWRVTAGSGLRWLLQRADHPWDLVISDHRLSDGTGRDVIQYLRSQRPDLPALIITGDTSPEQLHRLAHSGLPVLHKPFRAEKLRAMIDQTMTRSDDSVRKPGQGYQGLG